MTNEEINIAIAEAYGWKLLTNNRWTEPHGIYADLPNFTTDLNAMHEAENALDLAARRKFRNILSRHTIPKLAAIHATARQRAEAFLKTLNLYTP